MRRRIILTVVILILQLHVFAAVTAIYVPESYVTLKIKPGPWTSDTVLGAKLGTFIITSTTGQIYNPSLVNIGEVSNGVYITGLMQDYDNGPYNIRTNKFYIVSVAYPYGMGGEPIVQTLYTERWPVISWDLSTVNQSTLYVEMYIVNLNENNYHASAGYRPAQYFKLDTPYTLPSDFNPFFSIAVAHNPGTDIGTYVDTNGLVNGGFGAYVPSNGVPGPDNTPLIGAGAYTNPDNPSSPGFYYGDVPQQTIFAIYFSTPTASFSVQDALGSSRVTINQAVVQIDHGVQGQTYSQQISFSDNSGTNGFMLRPQSLPGYGISYRLYFGSTEVEEGVPITWGGLTADNLNNSMDVKIGGINPTSIATLVEGQYSGTITVTISNPN